MYKITIDKARFPARVGWWDDERAYPQMVELDLILELSEKVPNPPRDLAQTVDYMQVLALVRHMCAEKEWKLLEEMCSDIGAEILKLGNSIEAALVRVGKNVASEMRGVSVEARFSRDSRS